jgi:hypothetical protein
MTTDKKTHLSDFSDLRAAFGVLADIIQTNGSVTPARGAVKLSGIPRARWREISGKVQANAEMVRTLMSGTGQRSAVRDRREVVLSVLACENPETGTRSFETTAILVIGRGAIHKTLRVTSEDAQWREKLCAFTDWDEVQGVIAAAEGNNQRAMIGLVLQLAGIGRGRLEMIEAEVPEEVDEAAQSVRGADWLKAGLLRFKSSSGEALWYLMRIRSVHARMVRVRKQGQYTAMALAAMYASGLDVARMAEITGMSEGLVEKLTPRPGKTAHEPASFDALGPVFQDVSETSDPRAAMCADRVWKGAAIYARILDRRIRVGAAARKEIAEGEDIVSVSRKLGIARRDLVRVLSVRQADAVEERERFVRAIIDPRMVREATI